MRDIRVAPGPEQRVDKRGVDISTAATVVSAVSNKRIVITDIIASTGTAGTFTIYDDSTEVLDIYLDAKASFSANLQTPIAITAGNAVKLGSSTSNTNYSVVISYYIEV
tara:strand:+ start:1198 stop:1524 length:327 start_codon:yes stop_codon:yes gene_type:complete